MSPCTPLARWALNLPPRTDAFDMVARCANAQWRGLTKEERCAITLASNDVPVYWPWHKPAMARGIWTVHHDGTGRTLVLIGIKDS